MILNQLVTVNVLSSNEIIEYIKTEKVFELKEEEDKSFMSV
jgi:hypothetical protein